MGLVVFAILLNSGGGNLKLIDIMIHFLYQNFHLFSK